MSSRTATLVLVALTLSCSSKSREQPAEQPAGDRPTATASARAKGPHHGGNVRMPSNEPRYFNPIIETRFNRVNPLIFEGLVGLGSNLEPVPSLAQSWDISKDNRTITFRLQKGVLWQDGQPFTSKDVAFTFQVMRETKLPTVWRGYFTDVESLETPDDHTVVVKYRKPYAPALVSWTMAILPRHVYGGGDLGASKGNREPVGTGPFKLSRVEPGKRIILVANDKWWRGRPNLDSVELLVDLDNPLQALEDNQVDFVEVTSIDDWTAHVTQPGFRERFDVTSTVESKFRAIAWNTQKKPFDDRRVRQALTLAMNRSRVVDNVFQSEARLLSAPFFPNMFGIDHSIAPYPFDLDRAVKLLDQAGLPSVDGKRFSVELLVLRSLRGPNNDEMLAIFRRDLDAIGIDLRVRFVTGREFFEKMVLRDFDAAFYGTLPDIPDPDPYAYLHSSMIGTGQNFAGYASAEADKLLEEARTTLSRDERQALYHKLHALLHQDMPYTPLYAPFGKYAWNRALRGVNPADVGPQARVPGVASWWIDAGG